MSLPTVTSYPLVALHDGKLVDPMGQQWQIECLARWLLSKPLDERRAFLAGWDRNGKAKAAEQVRDVMTALHKAKKKVETQ